MSLTTDGFVLNVAAWSESELHGVEVLSLRDDRLLAAKAVTDKDNFRKQVIDPKSVNVLSSMPPQPMSPSFILRTMASKR